MSDTITPAPVEPDGPAIALSGGGFRAALFHLGVLWRLNELGWLGKSVRISSVSGGSILNGYLGWKWRDLTFSQDGVATNFETVVGEPIQAFCARTIDVGIIAWSGINILRNASSLLIKAYHKHLFDDATLQDFPDDADGPRFIIYSTNLQTSSGVRFSRPFLADYRIGLYPNPDTPLAVCVAASSAFPPLLTPLRLKLDPEHWQQAGQGPLYPDIRYRKMLVLADGGVYDNMGVQTLMGEKEGPSGPIPRFSPMIVSSAGAPLNPEPKVGFFGSRITRTIDIPIEQVRALRRSELLDDFIAGRRFGTLWKINTTIAAFGLADPIVNDSDTTRAMAAVPTRLAAFSPKIRGELVNWGYVIADTAIRRYIDPAPLGDSWAWPVPDYPLPKGSK